MEKSRKKRDEEEEARLQEALHEFQNAFEHDGSRSGKNALPKTFVRGDVVNAEKGTVHAQAAPSSIYKPTPIVPAKSSRPPLSVEQSKRIAEEAARKIMQQASKSGSSSRDGGSGLHPAVDRPPKPGTKKVVERSRMSNLEIFKEELKQVQALRQERKGLRQQLQEKLGVDSETIDRIAPSLDNPYLDGGSSAYDDDPTTTNLYICNFPSDVSMDDIYATFGTFGPLASAKIIYPRPDDPNERKRDFYSGFAAFMVRNDAERALCCMNGEKLRGTEMRVTWGRPVTIPPVPFFVPIALRELAMPDPPSGLPFNARPAGDDLKEFLAKHHELPQLNVSLPEGNAELRRDYYKMLCNSVVRVVVPTERWCLKRYAVEVIEFLVREGPLFEALLMAREKANPVYRFLFENHHPTHVYYRWKLYSVLQGDDRSSWRLERFKMFDDPSGPWWEPPPHSLIENGMPPQLYKTAYVPKRKEKCSSTRGSHHRRKRARSDRSRSPESGSDDEVANNRSRRRGDGERRRSEAKKWKGVLDAKERDELEDIIRNLIPERDTIGDATCWCLEHAECAKEIVQCLLESLSIKDTPLHKKIARFYLCSDILANCGTRLRDVFYFRQYFGEVLSQLFISLNDALESCSRIKAEQFRSRVMLCFRMWEDNSLYPTDVLIQMQNVFLGLTKPSEEQEGGGVEAGDEEDLDGAPIVDEAMETMGEDIDGVPLEETAAKQQLPPEEAAAVHESRFTTSSWSQVDVESEQRQQPPTTTKWERFTGESKWEEASQDTAAAASNSSMHAIRISPDHGRRVTSRPGNNSNNGVGEDTSGLGEGRTSDEPPGSSKEEDEERRRMLREIELKVMTLQDELEANSLPPRRVEEEVTSYRRKLMSRMEEKPAREPIKAPVARIETERRSGGERTSRIEQRSGESSRDEHQRRRSRDRERRSSRDNDRDHSQSQFRRRERTPERRRR